MEITKEDSIAKMIFWQGLTTSILSLFVLLAWGLLLYYINENLIYGYLVDDYISKGLLIGFCTLLTYIVYLLYKSFFLLKTYQKNQEELDLELAFNQQSRFWRMIPILLILSLVAFIFSSVFLYL